MNELVFFEIPKQNLKIQIVKKSDEILEQIRKESAETAVMPDVAQYYTDIYFPKAPSDRPYTFSSIVLSSDGKMAYGDNPSGPLIAKNNFLDPDGSLGDFWVLNVLRAYADGIIIGARTLLSEPGITCHVYEERLTRQRREVLGKKYQPCGVIVSLDGTDIPFDHYIFNVDPKEEYKLVIATSPKGSGTRWRFSKAARCCSRSRTVPMRRWRRRTWCDDAGCRTTVRPRAGDAAQPYGRRIAVRGDRRGAVA